MPKATQDGKGIGSRRLVHVAGSRHLGQPAIESQESLERQDDSLVETEVSRLTVCGQCGAVLHNAEEISAVDQQGRYLCSSCAGIRCVACGVVCGPRSRMNVLGFGGPYCRSHGVRLVLLWLLVIGGIIAMLIFAPKECSLYL
jgi:hypothetical protein